MSLEWVLEKTKRLKILLLNLKLHSSTLWRELAILRSILDSVYNLKHVLQVHIETVNSDNLTVQIHN